MQNPNPSIGQRPTPTKWTLKSVITQLVVDVQGLNPRALDQHHDYLRTYARSLQPEVHRFRQALKNEPAKSSAEEMADRDFVVSLKSIVDSSFVHTSSPGLDGQSVALQKMITDVEAMVEAFRGVEQTMKKGKGTAEGSQKSLASNCGDILKADPFATTRGQSQWQNVQPVDSLSDLQLRSRVETYQKMCRKEENIPGATLTEELRQAWILLLANALTFEPAFWSLCNDARQAGGLEITAELQIDALWGLGQFLFAFHSIYDNFEEAWHDFASKNSAEIFARARLEMEELLDRADKQITGKESHSFLARPHSVDPPQSMTTLLSIVQDDTRESILRNRVRNFLRPSEQHSTNKLASSQNLLDFYAAKEDMEPEAVEDHFSKDALALLTSNFLDFTLQPMPRLTLEELSHFKRASSTHYVHSSLLDVRGSRAKGGAAAGNIEDGAQNFDSGDEDALEEAEMGQGGGSGSKADEEAGKKKSRAEDDETPQYAWLKQHFRKIKGPVYLPGWKMSEQTPFSKVPNSVKYISETMAEVRQKAARDSESAAQSAKRYDRQEYTRDRLHANLYRRKMPLASLDSFNVARMISGQSQYDHTQTGRAIKGAMRDLENAFERGSRTQWNAEHAKKYAAILGDTTNRSKETSASKSKFGRFTETLLYDNWLHVRKFLQGLGFFMNNESFDDFLHATEKNIIMLIAVLQGGVADPTPFILCFDYVLRELWRMLLKKRDYKWSTGLNETCESSTTLHFMEMLMTT